jgi:RimJ/RimL family protein N-acetyltransferase
MIHPPETFATERLLLRRPTLADAQAIFEEYAGDPEVTKFLAWHPHRNIEDTRAFLAKAESQWQSGRRFAWALTQRGTEHVIGMVGCGVRAWQADLGYVLGRNFWGQSLMLEAVAEVIGWLLEQPSVFRVWAVCDTEHRASARVLEKAGMQREGVLRRFMVHPNISSEPRDCLCYSRVRGAAVPQMPLQDVTRGR